MSERYLHQGSYFVQRLIEAAERVTKAENEFELNAAADLLLNALEPFKDAVVFAAWHVDDIKSKILDVQSKRAILEITATSKYLNHDAHREALRLVTEAYQENPTSM